MTHHPAKNPYAHVWIEAQATLRELIAEVHQLGVHLDSSRRNLNWRGGAEEYFQTQAARQHHYLHRNNDYLRQLSKWVQYAEQLPPSSTGGAA